MCYIAIVDISWLRINDDKITEVEQQFAHDDVLHYQALIILFVLVLFFFFKFESYGMRFFFVSAHKEDTTDLNSLLFFRCNQ